MSNIFSDQRQLSEDEDITCQTLLRAGFTKSGLYTLKNESIPYIAFCDMEESGIETQIDMLQGPQGVQGIQGLPGPKGETGARGQPGIVETKLVKVWNFPNDTKDKVLSQYASF